MNGGGAFGGVGGLLDADGDDAYVADGRGANGGGSADEVCFSVGCVGVPAGVGRLVDLGGVDSYADDVVACVDCSVVPKGTVGAQSDSAHAT